MNSCDDSNAFDMNSLLDAIADVIQKDESKSDFQDIIDGLEKLGITKNVECIAEDVVMKAVVKRKKEVDGLQVNNATVNNLIRTEGRITRSKARDLLNQVVSISMEEGGRRKSKGTKKAPKKKGGMSPTMPLAADSVPSLEGGKGRSLWSSVSSANRAYNTVKTAGGSVPFAPKKGGMSPVKSQTAGAAPIKTQKAGSASDLATKLKSFLGGRSCSNESCGNDQEAGKRKTIKRKTTKPKAKK